MTLPWIQRFQQKEITLFLFSSPMLLSTSNYKWSSTTSHQTNRGQPQVHDTLGYVRGKHSVHVDLLLKEVRHHDDHGDQITTVLLLNHSFRSMIICFINLNQNCCFITSVIALSSPTFQFHAKKRPKRFSMIPKKNRFGQFATTIEYYMTRWSTTYFFPHFLQLWLTSRCLALSFTGTKMPFFYHTTQTVFLSSKWWYPPFFPLRSHSHPHTQHTITTPTYPYISPRVTPKWTINMVLLQSTLSLHFFPSRSSSNYNEYYPN